MLKYALIIISFTAGSLGLAMNQTGSKSYSPDDFIESVHITTADKKPFCVPKAWLKDTPWGCVTLNAMKEQSGPICLDVDSNTFKLIVHALQLSCSCNQVGCSSKQKYKTFAAALLKIPTVSQLTAPQLLDTLYKLEYAGVEEEWLSAFAEQFAIKTKDSPLEYEDNDVSRSKNWITHWRYAIKADNIEDDDNVTISLSEYLKHNSASHHIKLIPAISGAQPAGYSIDFSYLQLGDIDEFWQTLKKELDINPANVIEICLEGNKLTALPHDFLTGCINLITFSADSNHLSNLHQDFFKQCPNLKTINLSTNELTTLDPNLLSNNRRITQIWLEDNPWEVLNSNLLAPCVLINAQKGQQYIESVLAEAQKRKKRKREEIEQENNATTTTQSNNNSPNETKFQKTE